MVAAVWYHTALSRDGAVAASLASSLALSCSSALTDHSFVVARRRGASPDARAFEVTEEALCSPQARGYTMPPVVYV